MQPGEAVATDLEAFPVEFIPKGLRKARDLLRPMDAEVPGVDPDDLLRQPLVLLRPCGVKIRIGLAAPVFVRAGGGDPQNSARLFPRRRGSARSRRSPRGPPCRRSLPKPAVELRPLPDRRMTSCAGRKREIPARLAQDLIGLISLACSHRPAGVRGSRVQAPSCARPSRSTRQPACPHRPWPS